MQTLDGNIKELNELNKLLATLILRKEALTQSIISSFNHNHEGQRQYKHDVWKIEIKTPCIYSLNKKLYEEKKEILPANFNPIKESIAYSIDKHLCEDYMINSPQSVKDILIELIEKKPGKPSVTIKENI